MNNKQGGLIKEIVLIIIVLAILSYFGFSFSGFVHNPSVNAIWIPLTHFFSWIIGTFFYIIRQAVSIIITAFNALVNFLKGIHH